MDVYHGSEQGGKKKRIHIELADAAVPRQEKLQEAGRVSGEGAGGERCERARALMVDRVSFHPWTPKQYSE